MKINKTDNLKVFVFLVWRYIPYEKTTEPSSTGMSIIAESKVIAMAVARRTIRELNKNQKRARCLDRFCLESPSNVYEEFEIKNGLVTGYF